VDLSQDLSIDGSTSVSRTVRYSRLARVVPSQQPFLTEIGSLNAQAVRAPNGDPVILFNVGILNIISYWWERAALLRNAPPGPGTLMASKELLDTYGFLLELVEKNGRASYPHPEGSLSEADLYWVLIRSIQVELFILAHEIGHIVLRHPLTSPQPWRQTDSLEEVGQDQFSKANEIKADLVGYHLYEKAWPRHQLSSGNLGLEDLLAPLDYFLVVRLIENNPEIAPSYRPGSTHPMAAERADMLMRLILYSRGGPEVAPEIAERCTQFWQLLQSMPNIPKATQEFFMSVTNLIRGAEWKQ
jgi:hypothetical protein